MKLFRSRDSSPLPSRRRRETQDEPQPAFRRNQTIVGYRGQVGASDIGQSARAGVHELRRHRRRLFRLLGLSLIGVALLALAVYQSIALPRVEFDGQDLIATAADKSTYEQAINGYLNRHFFERSRILLNTTGLAEYLQQNGYPEVASVSDRLEYAGLGATTIRLTVRRPVVSWSSGDKTLYVDANGQAFSRDLYAGSLIKVVDKSGVVSGGNQVLLSDRFLSFIGKTVGRFSDQGFKVARVELPPDTSHMILVSLDGVPYGVKMTVDRPAGGQAEDAARSINYLARQGRVPSGYIDVRVSGKAFYK